MNHDIPQRAVVHSVAAQITIVDEKGDGKAKAKAKGRD
jgi:hypothetical protein